MIGSQISHYRLISKLGGGSRGVVFHAEDTRNGRQVALKFLPFDLRDDQEARDAFVDEAQAASSIEHPNICTIHDIGNAEDGRMFVVMTLYEGETLKHRLEGGALPLAEAVRVVCQVADGLAAAHQRGIVHRDLKPANIMVTEDGGVKIVDFGLARVVSQGQPGLTQIGTSMGTPAYMSPEQTLGDSVDERSDLWSLGVVFYECLTGRLPFAGSNLPLVIQAIHSKEPVPPREIDPEIPAELERLVLACLAKDRDERFDSCQKLVEALEDYEEAEAGDGGEDRESGRAARAATGEPAAAASTEGVSTEGASKEGASKEGASKEGVSKPRGGCLLLLGAPLLGWLGLLLL